MDSLNMDQDLNVTRMTLQNILESRNLSQPFPVIPAGKDKDDPEIYPDPTAAFLGPNLWDDIKTNSNYLDFFAYLGNNQEDGQHTLENLDQSMKENEQRSLVTLDSPMARIEDMRTPQKVPISSHENNVPIQESTNLHLSVICPSVQTSSQPSPHDSASMQSFSSDTDESNRRVYTVDCKFSPSDLALATPPGHKHYDPTSTIFPEDELKPQPMIKKSRKNFVPDSLKDDRYWARRHKNNIAAKRSREARRLKENQIVLRASYLEKENNTLKDDVLRLQAENNLLKSRLKEYET